MSFGIRQSLGANNGPYQRSRINHADLVEEKNHTIFLNDILSNLKLEDYYFTKDTLSSDLKSKHYIISNTTLSRREDSKLPRQKSSKPLKEDHDLKPTPLEENNMKTPSRRGSLKIDRKLEKTLGSKLPVHGDQIGKEPHHQLKPILRCREHKLSQSDPILIPKSGTSSYTLHKRKSTSFRDSYWNPNLILTQKVILNNKRLYIKEKLFSEFPRIILLSDDIEAIYASNCEIQELPIEISAMNTLVQLDFSHNQFKEFPRQIVLLPLLNEVNFSNNKISTIPLDIGMMGELKSLYLSNNRIKVISDGFCLLSKLELLDLSYNKLKQLGDVALKCESLRTLNLRHNAIVDIPINLHKCLMQLENLNLACNRLNALPSLSGLTKLKTLDISYNQMKLLPDTLSQLISLENLLFGSNEIATIPEGISNLKNLKNFQGDNNMIETLPSEVSVYKKLEVFNVSRNQIKEFPMGLCRAVNLKVLNLSHNRLREIPSVITKLTKTVFNFSHNQLCTLPYQLAHMNLFDNQINIRNNPLDCLPEECRDNISAILKYLRHIKAKSSWNRMKLVLVGEEFVGKTSLRLQLSYQAKYGKRKKKELKDPVATDGIDIEDWTPFRHDEETDSVVFSSWDFAGQQIYHPTHQFFLTKRSIYLVVFNLANVRVSKIEYWLKTLKTRIGLDHSVIIVGTHCDKRDESKNSESLFCDMQRKFGTRFPFIKDYIAVSCKTGKGIDLLTRRLIELSTRLKKNGETVPQSYILLEGRIALHKEKTQVMTRVQFMKFAKDSGVRDRQIDHCLQFLHDAGVLVHYNDEKNSELSDLVILDPQWIVDLMSSIITMKHSYAKDGILLVENLPHIWKQYPSEEYGYLLKLLEKFEIAFKIGSIPDFVFEKSVFSTLPINISTPNQNTKCGYPGSLKSYILSNEKEKTKPVKDELASLKMEDRGRRRSNSMVQHIQRDHRLSLPLEDTAMFNMICKQFEKKDNIIIVPSLLPETPIQERMDTLWNNTSLFLWSMIGRRYHFDFLPVGFFSRFIIRCLHMSSLKPLYFWQNGIIIDSHTERALIEYDESHYQLDVLIKEKRGKGGKRANQILMLQLSDSIETLLSSWFRIKSKISIPCHKCLSETIFQVTNLKDPIYYFPIEDCILAVRDSLPGIMCQRINSKKKSKSRIFQPHVCRISMLCPDIAFSSVQYLAMNYSELKLIGEIGNGSYATLWEAEYKSQPVAVKILKYTDESSNLLSESYRELLHETFIMKGLDSPYIVELKGIITKPLAMVMEFFPLGSLDKYLQRDSEHYRPLSWKFRYKIGHDIAKGMAYLHKEDFIHRDLRSPNILVASFTETEVVAKVADFGMTVVYAEGMAGGDFNERWTAPEILQNNQYDCKVDQYSFGIVLWELLQVGTPFFEYQEQFAGKPRLDFFQAVASGLRPTLPSDCPKGYAELIQKCWASDPCDRPNFDNIASALYYMYEKL